jgi:hypothetical protein
VRWTLSTTVKMSQGSTMRRVGKLDSCVGSVASRFGYERRDGGLRVCEQRERRFAKVQERALQQRQVCIRHQDLCAAGQKHRIIDRDLLDHGR